MKRIEQGSVLDSFREILGSTTFQECWITPGAAKVAIKYMSNFRGIDARIINIDSNNVRL